MNIQRRSLLTFIEQTYFHTNNAYTRAMYRCECGTVKEVNMRKVRELRTLSCGCLNYTRVNRSGHKLSKHPLYRILKGIMGRCYNKNYPAYPDYGGRGVIVCDEWINDRGAFVMWGIENGWEKGLEIDKDIKGNGLLYSPDTCIFVTKEENCNARRSNVLLEFGGQSKNMKQWSKIIGISPSLIRQRLIKLGWSIDKTLSTPAQKSKPYVCIKKRTGRPKTKVA